MQSQRYVIATTHSKPLYFLSPFDMDFYSLVDSMAEATVFCSKRDARDFAMDCGLLTWQYIPLHQKH